MSLYVSQRIGIAAVSAALCGVALCGSRAGAEDAAPRKPVVPPIVSLSVQPSAISLDDSRDVRSLVITGHAAKGFLVDLSPIARIKPISPSSSSPNSALPIVKIDSDGAIHPLRAGKGSLLVTAAGRSIAVPIVVKSMANPPISFVREVMPILSKAGCNAGTCHGSAKGKNGFKLSLRGYDADYDYRALVDDVTGRRFNRADPAQSLMLLKPTGSVPHKGGVVFPVGSPYYTVLKRWISEGVRSDVGSVKRVASLEILPSVPNVTLPGMTQKTIVIGRYPDGSERDVSRESVFTSSLPEVALVAPDGEIKAVRRGEAAFLVRYEGSYGAANVTVLGDRTGYRWTPMPETGYIDQLVDKKLQKVRALPSGVCDDTTFLRRVSIDLTGVPPTPEAVTAFLANTSPTAQKRTDLVDSLLKSTDFDDHWTNKWADLLDCNSKYLGDAGVLKFRDWIHTAVATNMPYNTFVQDLMTATGDTLHEPAGNYMRIIKDTSTATENVTQLFLGVRFSCAKCHDHPFERWTQNEYYQLGAFFAQVGYKAGSGPGGEVVFNKGAGEVMHPKTGLAVLPSVPVGHLTTAASSDRRAEFSDWLTSRDNPFFSRAMANRLWSYMLGKGIIDPVDDIRGSNPPSNPELLEALNKDFVDSGFNIRHLLRTIALSRTYQASLKPNRWNLDDKINFSHAIPRRLEAEELLDAINLSTGMTTAFAGLPAGTKADQLPDATAAGGDGFLDLFGKPARETPCECERSTTVSLGQTLNLINGPTISDKIASPTGRLSRLIKSNLTDEQLISQIFLATLCREPSKKETKEALSTLHTATSRTEAAQDLMWALVNSPAFLFNR